MSFEENIDFIQDGEDVSAAVLNRPANQFASRLDLLEKLDRESTLDLSFDKQTFKTYEDGQTRLPFEDVLDFTRASEASYFDPTGKLRTAAVNEPRFTYDPVTGEPEGLLIEDRSTNLLLWSEDFDNVVWTKNGVTVTANSVSALDGALTADKVVETAVDEEHNIVQDFTAPSGKLSYTFFAKADEINSITTRRLNTVLDNDIVTFDLTNGTASIAAGTNGGSVEEVGDGWYKCTAYLNAPVGGSTGLRLYLGSSITPYLGDGTSGLLIWGAQAEQGSFPSSYIKTEGSQVTRSVDNCSRTLGSEFNASEGTFVAEFEKPLDNFGILQGDSAADALIYDNSYSALGQVQSFNGASLIRVSATWRETGNKAAISYSSEGRMLSFNGINSALNPDPSIGNVNSLKIGASRNASLNKGIKNVRFIPRALSATELQKLTS